MTVKSAPWSGKLGRSFAIIGIVLLTALPVWASNGFGPAGDTGNGAGDYSFGALLELPQGALHLARGGNGGGGNGSGGESAGSGDCDGSGSGGSNGAGGNGPGDGTGTGEGPADGTGFGPGSGECLVELS